MKIKNILLYCTLSFFTTFIPYITNPPTAGGSVFDKMPTPEELEEINKFLETLSEEELADLAKIGEEIIKEAEKEGKPLFPNTPPVQTQQKTPQVKPPVKTPEKPQEVVKPKQPELSVKDKTMLQAMLSSLADSIAGLRQKAASDEKLFDMLKPHTTNLNDITYYLNVVNYSKYLGCLMEKEFTPLRKELESLTPQLAHLYDQLQVPELSTKKLDTHTIEKNKALFKKAEQTLELFLETLKTAITQKHIITDLERVLKKYEPEALKIKQEREEKEKKALAQAKTLPTTNTKIISAGTSQKPTTQKYAGRPHYNTARPTRSGYAPSGRSNTASQYNGGAVNNQKSSATSSSTKPHTKKDEAKDENKKDEKRKLTPAEESAVIGDQIKSKLAKINSKVISNKERLHIFMNDYLISKDPLDSTISAPLKDIIEDLTFDLNRTKKDIGSWLTKVAKHTDTAQDYKQYTSALKSFMKTEFADAKNLFDTTKLTLTKMPLATPRSEEHKGDLTDLSGAFDKLYKEIDKIV